MKRIRSILSAHKMLTLCVAVLMLISLTFASISIAKSNPQPVAAIEAEPAVVTEGEKKACLWYRRHIYYSDATHSTSVGSRRWFCDGSIGTAGTVTIYFDEFECDCVEEPK